MATTTPAPAEHEHGHPGIVLATLALASLMSVMDLFIVTRGCKTCFGAPARGRWVHVPAFEPNRPADTGSRGGVVGVARRSERYRALCLAVIGPS